MPAPASLRRRDTPRCNIFRLPAPCNCMPGARTSFGRPCVPTSTLSLGTIRAAGLCRSARLFAVTVDSAQTSTPNPSPSPEPRFPAKAVSRYLNTVKTPTLIVAAVLVLAAADIALIQPPDLAARLAAKPAIFQVGPNVLYRSKHI